jgi:pimeloyl-ACP methyl ester carboxylesterase
VRAPYPDPPADARVFLPNLPLPLRHLRVDGVELAVADSGPPAGADPGSDAGLPPVLLIHGLTATLDYFRLNLPALARRRRVIALDLPGFGRSASPERAPYSIPYFVETVLGLCDRLGLERVALVGNSMGGQIALATAILHPVRVQRLVLVNAAGGGMPPAWVRGSLDVLGRAALLHRAPVPHRAWRAVFSWLFPGQERLASEFADHYHRAHADHDGHRRVRVALRAFRGMLDYDLRPRLGEVQAPTLIVWGGRDGLMPLRGGQRLREGIPDSRLLVYTQAGHCPMLELPDQFNDDATSFLSGQLPPGAE